MDTFGQLVRINCIRLYVIFHPGCCVSSVLIGSLNHDYQLIYRVSVYRN